MRYLDGRSRVDPAEFVTAPDRPACALTVQFGFAAHVREPPKKKPRHGGGKFGGRFVGGPGKGSAPFATALTLGP